MFSDETYPRQCSEIVVLDRLAPAGILAVVYEARRRRRVVRIPDGAIVEVPGPERRPEAPDDPPGVLEVATDGGPATIHHANLGLIAAHLSFSGVFLLASAEVAAVYGAEATLLG